MCATLGQVHVVLAAAGAVGIADDLDLVLVELFERARQVVQRLIETWGNVRRIGSERDVARHDQLDLVALALHFNTGVGHAGAQFFLLLVGVVAVTGGGSTDYCRTDKRTLATVIVVDRSTGQRTGQSAEATVFRGLAHALGAAIRLTLRLTVIRVGRGTAGQYGHGSSDNHQTTHGEHVKLLLFLHSVVQRTKASAFAGVGSC
ncbi:hypothetical protein D9M73_139560 [compost metagenome]